MNQATITANNYFVESIIEKEMQLYQINPMEHPKNLDLLFQALKTIKPTSVESEWVFSAMGWFVTKIRNRLDDKTLDALIKMRQYYKRPKVTLSQPDTNNE